MNGRVSWGRFTSASVASLLHMFKHVVVAAELTQTFVGGRAGDSLVVWCRWLLRRRSSRIVYPFARNVRESEVSSNA
jgi:hypothetical protein